MTFYGHLVRYNKNRLSKMILAFVQSRKTIRGHGWVGASGIERKKCILIRAQQREIQSDSKKIKGFRENQTDKRSWIK